MRPKPLQSLDLILSLSKDGAWISALFSIPLDFLIVFANLRISGEMGVDLREDGAHVRF